jgi:hypothetical protein
MGRQGGTSISIGVVLPCAMGWQGGTSIGVVLPCARRCAVYFIEGNHQWAGIGEQGGQQKGVTAEEETQCLWGVWWDWGL